MVYEVVAFFESVDKAVAAFNEGADFLEYGGGACGMCKLLHVVGERVAGLLHLFSYLGLSLLEPCWCFWGLGFLLSAEGLEQFMKDGAVNPSVAVEVDNEDEEGVACDDDERGRENAAQQYCKKVGALEG